MTLQINFAVAASVFSLLIFSAGAVSAEENRVQDVVICKSPSKVADAISGKSASVGKAVRTLRVYETKEKNESGESIDGCRATYSKTNVEQTVGSSRQMQQCQSILSGIQKNLEASNWSCRHAGRMAVLKSADAAKNEALGSASEASEVKSVVQ